MTVVNKNGLPLYWIDKDNNVHDFSVDEHEPIIKDEIISCKCLKEKGESVG